MYTSARIQIVVVRSSISKAAVPFCVSSPTQSVDQCIPIIHPVKNTKCLQNLAERVQKIWTSSGSALVPPQSGCGESGRVECPPTRLDFLLSDHHLVLTLINPCTRRKEKKESLCLTDTFFSLTAVIQYSPHSSPSSFISNSRVSTKMCLPGQ